MHVVLKEISYRIFNYIDDGQNYLEIEGDMKMVFYTDGETSERYE